MRPIVWADVTNTVEGTGTTGVQRAAKNLLAPLAAGDERLELRLVRWCEPCGTFLQPVSYTHLRAHETVLDLVCRLLLEKKTPKRKQNQPAT